jgi:hypothetical protein
MKDDGKIYLSKDEQIFLMEWLDVEDPIAAADKFASLLAEERSDPLKMQQYIQKIMKRIKK